MLTKKMLGLIFALGLMLVAAPATAQQVEPVIAINDLTESLNAVAIRGFNSTGGPADDSVITQETAIGSGEEEGDEGGSLVLVGGKIFTADDMHPWAEAIAISGNRIIAVGDNGEVLRHVRPHTRVIQLGGRVVIPGLNDAHVHVPILAPGSTLDTGNFIPGPGPSFAQVLSLIQAAVAQAPAGTWIFGIVGEAVLGDPNANRFSMDAVAPNNPVMLQIWAGHGTWINTAAMRAAGIAENEPDPFAGSYERVPGTDMVLGVLHEYAEHRMRRFVRSLVPLESKRSQFLAYATAVARFGVTSVSDLPFNDSKQDAEAVLDGLALPVRVRTICFPLLPTESCAARLKEHGSLVTSTGIKWILDGSPIERYAYVYDAYKDAPGWFGTFDVPMDPLKDIIASSLRGPRVANQLVLHSVGDHAIGNVIAALQAVAPDSVWRERRARIEHADMALPEHVALMKKMGLTVVQNPLHFAVDDLLAARYGADRLPQLQPFKTLLRNGIPLAIGSDSVFGVPNPYLDLMFATIHPTNPPEALTIEEAVTAYTLGSAHAEFAERDKGSLRIGKLADLAVLSQDIFTASPFALPGTVSLLTVTDGRIVYDAGVLH